MFTRDDIKRIQDYITEGLTTLEIANAFKLSPSTFRDKLQVAGYRVETVTTRSLKRIVAVELEDTATTQEAVAA